MTTCLTYLSLAEVCRDEGETTKMMTDFVDSAKELGEMETPPSTLIVAPTLQVRQKDFSDLLETKFRYLRREMDVQNYSQAKIRRDFQFWRHRPSHARP